MREWGGDEEEMPEGKLTINDAFCVLRWHTSHLWIRAVTGTLTLTHTRARAHITTHMATRRPARGA